MNRQLREVETPHNQTTHNQTTQSKHNTRTKDRSRKFTLNYERGKDDLTITMKQKGEQSRRKRKK